MWLFHSARSSNYDAAHVANAREMLLKHGLRPAIMIDASHGNCGKDDKLMPAVFEEIVRQRAAGDTSIIGAMLESNLVAGARNFPNRSTNSSTAKASPTPASIGRPP